MKSTKLRKFIILIEVGYIFENGNIHIDPVPCVYTIKCRQSEVMHMIPKVWSNWGDGATVITVRVSAL